MITLDVGVGSTLFSPCRSSSTVNAFTKVTRAGSTLMFTGCRKHTGLHQQAPGQRSAKYYEAKAYRVVNTTCFVLI